MAMEKAELEKVRASVRQQVGNRVQIRLDEGRHRTNVREGILQEAYPSIFTVLIDGEDPQQLLSFSYTDIITRGVRMRLC
ncbi:MAG: Veg family protein [Lachnospiraceae bacterium]